MCFYVVAQISTQSGATATATVASTELQSSSSFDLSLAASADASLNINTSKQGKTSVIIHSAINCHSVDRNDFRYAFATYL